MTQSSHWWSPVSKIKQCGPGIKAGTWAGPGLHGFIGCCSTRGESTPTSLTTLRVHPGRDAVGLTQKSVKIPPIWGHSPCIAMKCYLFRYSTMTNCALTFLILQTNLVTFETLQNNQGSSQKRNICKVNIFIYISFPCICFLT